MKKIVASCAQNILPLFLGVIIAATWVAGIVALATPHASFAAGEDCTGQDPATFCQTQNVNSYAVCATLSLAANPAAPRVCVPTVDQTKHGCPCGEGERCAIVQSYSSYFGGLTSELGPVCLNANDSFDPSDKTVKDACGFGDPCSSTDQACVAVHENPNGGVVTHTRCIAKSNLPTSSVNTASPINAGGVCGINGICQDDETCAVNGYDSGKTICVKKTNILSDVTCSQANVPCGSTIKGACLTTVNLNQPFAGVSYFEISNIQPQCVRLDAIPNGPQGVSKQICQTDTDCTIDPSYTFCIKNPQTQYGQCFSQINIVTDMNALPAADANPCKTEGQSNCNSTVPASLCATYLTKNTLVCIKYDNNGAALGTGAATGDTNIPHLAVTAERDSRFAPLLEITIPNLHFTDKLLGADTENGKTFVVPYIAQYFDAVYRYLIGLGVLLAILFMVVGGFRWMTAAGDSSAIGEAQTLVGHATLGLMLLIGMYTLLYVINPDLVKMKGLQILAPTQEVFDVSNDDAQPGQGADVPASVPGSQNGLISGLIGALPADKPACSAAAADYASQKLFDLAICVGGCHCAFTASHFLQYIGCTTVYDGSANWLAADLDASGWIAKPLGTLNKKQLPVGMLLGTGHAGISVGNGIQFQSASSKKNKFLEQINKKTGENCPYSTAEVKQNPALCNMCAKIPKEAPWTGRFCSDTQAWVRGSIWPTYWKFVVYPAGSGETVPTKVSCPLSMKGVSKTVTITQELCDYLKQANGKKNEEGN